MIAEDYVSFETAKLLKEKGFDWECHGYYDTNKHPDYILEHSSSEMDSNDGPDCYISAPTHQMAMKWLRLEHHIHIRPIHSSDETYSYEIYPMSGKYRSTYFTDRQVYPTHEEAVEAALKYVLENLI